MHIAQKAFREIFFPPALPASAFGLRGLPWWQHRAIIGTDNIMQTDTANISATTAKKSRVTTRVRKSPAKQASSKSKASSKRVKGLAMLLAPSGTTIAAIVKATQSQEHSVHGFLLGVIGKKLRLKLTSKAQC
jgi:hypothetical protein